MRLVRTKFAFDEISIHLRTVQPTPLMESYFVQYLLVAFYSEMEDALKQTISSRLMRIQDDQVAHFIAMTSEAMIRRVKKSEINDILKKFKCGDGDIIGNSLQDMNLQPYFDAVTNRHLVSHRDGVSMTMVSMASAIVCAEAILAEVERVLEPA